MLARVMRASLLVLLLVSCATFASCKDRKPSAPAGPATPATAAEPVPTVPLANSGGPAVPLAPAAMELAVSPDDKTLAVVELKRNPKEAGPQWRAYLRPAIETTPRVELKIPDDSVRALVFSPDGKELAVASNENDITIFDTTSGQETHHIAQSAYVLAWGAAGLLVNETLFDPTTEKPSRELGLPPAQGRKWASRNASYLLRTDAKPSHERPMKGGGREWIIPPSKVELVEVATGKRREIPNATSGDARVANDGTVVLPGFRVVTPTGQTRDVKGIPGIGNEWALSPDGKRVAVMDGSYSVHLVDLATGKQSSLDKPSGRVSSMIFAPSGRELYACSSEGVVLRWTLTN
jgi:WD40 repeat protein